MAEDNESLKAFKADALRRLNELRIPPSRVTIEFQDDLQDYQVLIRGSRLRSRQIEGILQTVAPILHVTFDNPDNQRLYGAAQAARYAASGSTRYIVGGS